MRALTSAELLEAWERGLSQPPAFRAVALLACACPERGSEELWELPLGQRDTLLLELRAAMFGPEFVSLAACPSCGERLELSFRAEEILAAPPAGEMSPAHTLCEAGVSVQFRLPNSVDMEAIGPAPEVEEASARLLERCVLFAERDGTTLTAAQLPPEVVAALSRRMAELDPQADVQLACACAQCGTEWNTAFDIAAYLWAEIEDRAKRLLRDVHRLASAYGWREADILAMSPTRRSLYLEWIENE